MERSRPPRESVSGNDAPLKKAMLRATSHVRWESRALGRKLAMISEKNSSKSVWYQKVATIFQFFF